MKLINIALILALFSGGLGAVDSMMDLSGENWFTGDVSPDIPDNNWENAVVDMEVENGGLLDDVKSYLYNAYLLAGILLSMLKGVFFVGLIIADIFHYDVGGINITGIIAGVINIGVWIIYAIGLYQLKHGDSIKHYM